VRARLRRLAHNQRFEDAARLRDRLSALEEVVARAEEIERLRGTRVCVLAPAREPGFRRMFALTGGRVAVRTIPDGPGGRLEVGAALAALSLAPISHAPEDADELLVVAGFLRRPGPELRIVGPEASEILAA
jgi:DNA polymerase-3 subunit epsilon